MGTDYPWCKIWTMIQRRKTVTVPVGQVPIGSDHPIVVQSMTNTDTADIEATVEQTRQLFEAGLRTGSGDGEHGASRPGHS